MADVLTRLPSTLPAQIPSLTPTRWKAVRDAAAAIAAAAQLVDTQGFGLLAGRTSGREENGGVFGKL